MKSSMLFLYFLLLFAGCQAKAQSKSLIISTNGVDSVKIGMSKSQVENITNAKLKLYIVPDSILKTQDTGITKNACKDCRENLICIYKGVAFVLTFFRHTTHQKSDFELVGISPTSALPVIETKTGIKVGMKENEFLEICKKNQYPYNCMDIDEKSKGCFFSDNLNKESAKVLMIKVSDSLITSLGVFNMIGD